MIFGPVKEMLYKGNDGNANPQSHAHSQFAPENTTPKIAKEYVLPTHTFELNNKHRKTKPNVKSTTHNNVYN